MAAHQDQPSLDLISHGDAAFEILKRLTIKDLFQMGTSSWTWKNLIDDADFKTLHYSWSTKNPLLLVVIPPQIFPNFYSRHQFHAADLYEELEEVKDDTKYPLVLASVNPADGGLLYRLTIQTLEEDFEVLSSGKGCLFCVRNSVDYNIFNPATKDMQTLPQADPPNANASGFGYIETRNAYALVKLFYGSCQIIMLAETGEIITPWRTIEERSPFSVSGHSGTMVGSTCYWMDDLRVRYPMMMRILCLDIDLEMFYRIDYPAPESYENNHDMHMGELQDKLFLTDTFPDGLKMDIWVRENGRFSEWGMKYRIDLSFLIDGFSGLKLIGDLLEGDEEGFLMFQDSEENEVVYYDVAARRFKEGQQLQVGNNIGYYNMMFPYTERFNSIRRPVPDEEAAGPVADEDGIVADEEGMHVAAD